MSENSEDIRTKITPEEHEFLTAVAMGSREEIASILRRLVRDFLDAKRHEYSVAARFATAEGIRRESTGNRRGTERHATGKAPK